jgi:Phage terminase, small subunit
MYDQHSGNITNREIANTLGVDEKVIAVWKQRDNWVKKNNVVQQSDKSCTTKKKVKQSKPFDDGTSETMMNESLTPEQRLFCIYYSKSFNAAQSYQKAYDCTYESALTAGPRLFGNVKVKKEVQRLSLIKAEQISITENDLIEFHMRVAFADIGEYVKIEKDLFYIKDFNKVDTQLIKEVKETAGGISIKLLDRCKSLDWLDRFFLINPMDRHKMEYDKRKLEIELIKLDYEAKKNEPQITETGSDNFLDALNAKAAEVWADE